MIAYEQKTERKKKASQNKADRIINQNSNKKETIAMNYSNRLNYRSKTKPLNQVVD